MGSISTIASVVSAISAVAGAGNQIFGGGQKKGGGMPAPQAPPMPQGPAPDQTTFDRPTLGQAPAFLKMGQGLSPIQQRSQIATRGVAGEGSAARDPQTLDYYRNLVLNDVVGEGGRPRSDAEILPVERQFISQIFGQPPRTGTTESFLSAVLRA